MAERQTNERLLQMISLVQEEAKEKALEIEAHTEQEYNLEKQKFLLLSKEKINVDYNKKYRQIDIKRKIERSAAINDSRLLKMKARQERMLEMLDLTKNSLIEVLKDQKKYTELLEKLIIQGLIKLQEHRVQIRIVQRDQNIIQNIIKSALQKYKQIMKEETKNDIEIEITLSETFLEESCVGGIIMLANEGRTRCINTLTEKLEEAYQIYQPQIRAMLFQ